MRSASGSSGGPIHMLRKMLFSFALAAFVSLSMGTPASAQEPTNQLTDFTFSAPFELPGGKVLPAGKYTFRIVDSPSNRHVVQILSEDGKEMLATILAIPAQRQDPPNEPVVRFMHAAANMPPAVKTWWYPGRTIGHEFIYPKEQARRLAARQREAVLTVKTDVTTTETMQTADLARIDAAGVEAAISAETAAAEVARGTETAVTTAAQATTTAARTAVDTTARAVETTVTETPRTSLPRTSTVLPLVGLIGLASLFGAGALRLRRK